MEVPKQIICVGNSVESRDRRIKEWANEQRRMWVDTCLGGRPCELLVSKRLFRELHAFAQEKWNSLGCDLRYAEGSMQGEGNPLFFRGIPIISY